MTPLMPSCKACSHPGIKAARQCKQAMNMANASQFTQAGILLRQALNGLGQGRLPIVRARLLNSLGLVYAQQAQTRKARNCFSLSLQLVERHLGADNWLHARIAGNKERLGSS